MTDDAYEDTPHSDWCDGCADCAPPCRNCGEQTGTPEHPGTDFWCELRRAESFGL